MSRENEIWDRAQDAIDAWLRSYEIPGDEPSLSLNDCTTLKAAIHTALAQAEKTIASAVFNLEATQRNQADAILARRRAEDALAAAEARAARLVTLVTAQDRLLDAYRTAHQGRIVSASAALAVVEARRALAPGDRGECRHSGFLEARLHDGTGEVWRTCTDCGFRWEAAPAPRDPEQ